MDINSLAHTKWNCKYHIVFAPKYRRKVAYGKMKQDIANILSMLCKRKSVEIVEAEICPDHVHMLVKIPPSLSVSSFVGYLKGKSTLMIFERHANLIQIWKSPFLVQRILRRYCREKCKEDTRIYSKSITK
jgi:putative transposase